MPAINALDKAKIEPTDKSIPPVKITNVIPNAINALIATWRSKFKILSGSKKLGFNTDTMTTKIKSPSSGPSFCIMLDI